MKLKTTRKHLRDNVAAAWLWCAGYCEIRALNEADAFAYAPGVYGWNFDVWNYSGEVICAGYRNMPGHRIPSFIVDECNAIYKEIGKKAALDYLVSALATYRKKGENKK